MIRNNYTNKYCNNMNIRCDIIRSNHYFDRIDDDDEGDGNFSETVVRQTRLYDYIISTTIG